MRIQYINKLCANSLVSYTRNGLDRGGNPRVCRNYSDIGEGWVVGRRAVNFNYVRKITREMSCWKRSSMTLDVITVRGVVRGEARSQAKISGKPISLRSFLPHQYHYVIPGDLVGKFSPGGGMRVPFYLVGERLCLLCSRADASTPSPNSVLGFAIWYTTGSLVIGMLC